ncbi:chromate transporter [Azospirillum sp. TSH100]|uniref:chromate efflux transporter n=1 Tax=Azospirillum sp. TSH100 TaxID=652764 RepID=UPI000D607263|nr:chromate efflux transporter [Azospirillum sp. TSH100]PWC88899.1 chromate transporter [Azospirillum sp. TSH100]QCG86854.1 chromate efflux transporter [Azospirillum sp. TSH100]
MSDSPSPHPSTAPSPAPPFFTFCLYWLRLGLTSFGGPAGQIAMMQSELVDRRRWIDQTRFLHALNFCMLLPGPEAQQLATYIGWRMYGVRGGLLAGGLFVLPGALVLLALSWIAAAHGDTGLVGALFDGIKPAVVAIIAAAVWRLGRRTLKGPPAVAMAGAAFLALALLHLPFPLVIGAAAVVGGVAARLGHHWFAHPHPVADDDDAADLTAEPAPRTGRLLVLLALGVVLWVVPVGAILLAFGPDPWRGVAALFTKAAFVTFGGAYAVLPYIAGQAVDSYGWLSSREMIDGLALAETTPGPLILVTQYVGFFAGWNRPGALSPALAGTLGSALTTYVTFLPCFLFIFAGAPYLERLIHNRLAAGALAAIAAAVVGVILNLGVYLGMAVLMPDGQHTAGNLIWAWAIMLTALYALTRRSVAIHWVVAGGAAAGLIQALAASSF